MVWLSEASESRSFSFILSARMIALSNEVVCESRLMFGTAGSNSVTMML